MKRSEAEEGTGSRTLPDAAVQMQLFARRHPSDSKAPESSRRFGSCSILALRTFRTSCFMFLRPPYGCSCKHGSRMAVWCFKLSARQLILAEPGRFFPVRR